MKKSIFGALLLSLVLAGCVESEVHSGWDNGGEFGKLTPMSVEYSSHKLGLTQASNCDDFRSHLLDSVARQVAEARFTASHAYYYDYNWGIKDEAGFDSSSASPGGASADAGEYTTTNVQEAGVDELDTVKNDGEYMYTLQDGVVHIVRAWPAKSMTEVASLDVSASDSYGSNAGGILLSNNKLIVIGSSAGANDYYYDGYYGSNYQRRTTVRVYDVSTPAVPVLAKTHVIDGSYVDARLIGDRIFIVLNEKPIAQSFDIAGIAKADINGVPRFNDPYDDPDFNYDDWSEKKWSAYNEKVDAWNAKKDENIEKYLPYIRAYVEKKYQDFSDFSWPQVTMDSVSRNAIECTDVFIPATASRQNGLLMLSELSGSNFENFSAKAVADSGWTVYASTDNLYVASSSINWWYYDSDYYTHIHHFSLGKASGMLKYVNSAEVNGSVEESLWMSEYDNHLRVVSNPCGSGNCSEGHNLSVLDITTPSLMNQTGIVTGFGAGESIYAARMSGNRGYVVTYRNTDPLFTFDLSSHSSPKQVGELQINGYSSYIHFVGDNHLLTIGEDGDEFGNTTGLQLQLFDVTNLANPKVKYKTLIHRDGSNYDNGYYDYSNATSSAMSNHHAFTYHEASGLLAIPVNIDSYHSNYDNYAYFSGMFIYRITPDSDFEFLGGVDHNDLNPNKSYYYDWWTNVDRARFYFAKNGVYDKDAYVYTISEHGIKANDANAPKNQVSMVEF